MAFTIVEYKGNLYAFDINDTFHNRGGDSYFAWKVTKDYKRDERYKFSRKIPKGGYIEVGSVGNIFK